MGKILNAGTTVFLVQVTEFERGWGSRPEGFLVFETEQDRTQFLKDMNAQKGYVVPDYYWDYASVVRPHQLTEMKELHTTPDTSILTTWLST